MITRATLLCETKEVTHWEFEFKLNERYYLVDIIDRKDHWHFMTFGNQFNVWVDWGSLHKEEIVDYNLDHLEAIVLAEALTPLAKVHALMTD